MPHLWGRENPYPRPRERVLPAGAEADLFGGGEREEPLPRVRVFPFHMRAAIARRMTRSSPILHGPALVTNLRLAWNAGASSPTEGFTLGVALANVTENDVLLTASRAWRELLDDMVATTGFPAGGVRGFSNVSAAQLQHYPGIPLHIPIIETEFVLVFTFYNNTAGIADLGGHVVLIENVSREMLTAPVS